MLSACIFLKNTFELDDVSSSSPSLVSYFIVGVERLNPGQYQASNSGKIRKKAETKLQPTSQPKQPTFETAFKETHGP